ncbi:ran gtpase-activating protein 1, putative [Ichthyophthirius multifiliis]|uniref:Ran gtpase-activating protein 1, putative n=1 Tax=Ichthyophthirius multifiliis TaxID=5932 RepID=G0QZZ8_ICHMU|nr:ran gtpase-activating protein 1, putative [Ichthyophthirius multifiliis]EGR29208.1 ran gtpase-activating protein 1, putative [Ichthyophthirius multifiliis]|eukprot:XP_004030444.1 ran gtpase-activating protein 1, putative [Ichthyophthirius multifiliis]
MDSTNTFKFTARVRPDKEKLIEDLKNLDQSEQDFLKEHIEKNIQHMVLTGNSYSKNFCEQLGEYFKKSQNLIKIDIHDIFVTRLKTEIPEAISFLGNSLIGKNITELDISDNAVNPFGAKALVPFLEQATNLKVFLINNGGLGIDGVITISQALSKGTPNLEKLSLTRNRAENEGAIALSKALPNLKKLKELIVFQDVIKKDGMINLLRSLAENCPELELLDVRDNFISEEAVIELVNLLKKTKNLKALNISDCNIQEKENTAIVEAIAISENKLVKLGYMYNELNDVQAKKLVDALVLKGTQLQQLDIKGNDLSELTQKYFKEKLKDNLSSLSKFESDDEDDEDQQLIKDFAQLKI